MSRKTILKATIAAAALYVAINASIFGYAVHLDCQGAWFRACWMIPFYAPVAAVAGTGATLVAIGVGIALLRTGRAISHRQSATQRHGEGT